MGKAMKILASLEHGRRRQRELLVERGYEPALDSVGSPTGQWWGPKGDCYRTLFDTLDAAWSHCRTTGP